MLGVDGIMILISACLLGLNTKYNGKSNYNELLVKYSHLGRYIPVCPEQLGGLSTPREPSEIINNLEECCPDGFYKVVTQSGKDNTSNFISGAEQVLHITRSFPVSAAILKENSPSCGVNMIYDGTFSKRLVHGSGITASYLKANAVPVYIETEITEELLKKLMEEDKIFV